MRMSALPYSVGVPIVRSVGLYCVIGARYWRGMATGGKVEDGSKLTKTATEAHGTSKVLESKVWFWCGARGYVNTAQDCIERGLCRRTWSRVHYPNQHLVFNIYDRSRMMFRVRVGL